MQADSDQPALRLLAEKARVRDATSPTFPPESFVGDSNRKQREQVLSRLGPGAAVSYARGVSKKGETGGQKKLDAATLERIAAIVESLFSETKLTVRQAREAWGIDIATLNRARNAQGSVGVGFLIKLRAVTGRPIDDLLGLPALAAQTAEAKAHETAMREAEEEAKRFGAPAAVIAHVRQNFAMSHRDPNLRKEAWIRAFLRTWTHWAASRVPELTTSARQWLELHPEPESRESLEETG